MPIFEYRCTKCGKITEYLTKGTDDKPSACPSCGNAGLEKVLSTPSPHTTNGGACSAGNCGLEMPCCGADLSCRKKPCKG